MSMEMNSGRVCYVHCNFCNTILASVHLQDLQLQKQHSATNTPIKENGSSSKCGRFGPIQVVHEQPKMSPIRPPEKRQRAPSAYNRFIKEEIQRIKASNPEISHREAFSTAAKNWAHFPHMHFGLKLESNNTANQDRLLAADQGSQKSLGF